MEPKNNHSSRLWVGLLVVILLAGAYFRFIGINWDENFHLHPDERFLTMVETSISPVESISQYFNTDESSLNPYNHGFGFYVYGTLPLFVVRYAAEWVGKTGYDQVHLVGRVLSACVDLLTVFLVFLIADRVYRNKGLALLAAAFSAFAVMQIQLSHYFTVDTFANFFTFLAIYYAVKILTATADTPSVSEPATINSNKLDSQKFLAALRSPSGNISDFILFGVALGMAMASKVSVAPLALVLPAVVAIRLKQIPESDRETQGLIFFRNLVLAALFSFLIFRIFQPYAFEGPGFFGLKPNEQWFSNLSDLSQQSKGNVDFPPALQWARRPLTFSLQNLILFGLGLPLGLLAWSGFIVMGYRIFRGDWQFHILVWIWTAIYFLWQSINFTRSMRYQIPIYPTLAIIAAWFVFFLWEKQRKNSLESSEIENNRFKTILPISLGAGVLFLTFLWAFAFTRIYTHPVTRVSASEWIYENIPSAINLPIETSEGVFNQRLPYKSGLIISPEKSVVIAFKPEVSGRLTEVIFSNIVAKPDSGDIKYLKASLYGDRQYQDALLSQTINDPFQKSGDPRGEAYQVVFDQDLVVDSDKTYFLKITIAPPSGEIEISGLISLGISSQGEIYWQVLPDPVETIDSEQDFSTQFTALENGVLSKIEIPHIVDWEAFPESKTLQLSIQHAGDIEGNASIAKLQDSFLPYSDARGGSYKFQLDKPVQLKENEQYVINIQKVDGPGSLALYGIRQAIESSWDDALPLSMYGYSPFDYSRGIYRSELNFEMYWDDNEEKRDRFNQILNNADYLFLSSNRQWGTTVRVPERYPLTETYYRNLLGCPPEKDIVWCYRVAKPGMFDENLGFELVSVFQSDPYLGDLRINTQFAEEAFTVYDHPKVMIFKKQQDYQPDKVREILNQVDLSKVVNLTPREASSFIGNLMLPTDRLETQRGGGTWSDYFNPGSTINHYPWLAALLWYGLFLFLGWVNFPVTRIAFYSLPDKGYPVIRLIGMLLLAYLVWIAGSIAIPVTRSLIFLVLLLLVLINGILLYKQGLSIFSEIKENINYYLIVELLFLAFFLFFLLIRVGNPDLWHPYKGGEKPMDFSYLNAVIKSSTYPPYDPWFAGGYINYYYYGFVLLGIPIKLSGILPSIAYNLALPMVFAMLAMAAFSFGWNLLSRRDDGDLKPGREQLIGAVVSSLSLLIIGNLGTVQMIWEGFQKLVVSNALIETANFFQKTAWAFQGILKFVGGENLPYGYGEWYWNPSRVIPGEPITEFPYFTFLYADLHAHLIALPLTVLALLWTISILKSQWKWGTPSGKNSKLYFACSFLFGGLIIGALKPTNSWDYPVYLGLGVVAILYTYIRYANIPGSAQHFYDDLRTRIPKALLWSVFLITLFMILYQPFSQWFGQAYTAVDLWKGEHTPIRSYFIHWGLFLFIALSWLVQESVDWMAKTPLSSLKKLNPYFWAIAGSFAILLLLVIGLVFIGVQISWIVLPLVFWSVILLLRPDRSDEQRAVLFMIPSGLVLTLAVELIVLRGDIGRMNTVFKFYLQAWTLLSLAAAVSLTWFYSAIRTTWLGFWRKFWNVLFLLLASGAFLFPLFASIDKIRDRISVSAPHSLNGMTYMLNSTYSDKDNEIDLSQDYEAIRWMQDNVTGSPVIVEANTPEYRWGNRFTIYTGLPGVVGWNWHQRQQRAVVPSEWVTERVDEISGFYTTLDRQETVDFLKKFSVSYIIVGQLEEIYYGENGLSKFADWNGELWEMVYEADDTRIYRVNRE